ncbi:MAG: hypothetical protein FJZ67_00890 [Bacteroidetes bacterium]|nr:hypothetical protein [Bacteroidota bacterium]
MISKWINTFIQSHLFLAISAYFFSIGILNQNDLSVHFSVALSLAVFGVYNSNRLNKSNNNKLPIETRFWYEKNAIILYSTAPVCLLMSALIYIYLLRQETLTLFIFGLTVLITALYIFTIKQLNLRKIPSTKAIWISIVWTIIAVVIPKLILGSFCWFNLHYLILFYALTIPGDMRDMEFDNPKMKTIPQLIGNQKSQILFYLLLVIFLMFNYLLEEKKPIEIILVLLFSLILFAKRFSFRYELMDGILLISGISSLIPF